MTKMDFYNKLAEMKQHSIITKQECEDMESLASWWEYTTDEFDRNIFYVVASLDNEDDIYRFFIIKN